ncbi:MAG TPA: PKD-like family lipoprotein [Puia sp.]|jgi:hypothetical protein|nr:PKD-like family lipoprotein [Puia sp.]
MIKLFDKIPGAAGFIAVCALLSAVSSCKRDLGNYTYTDLNQVHVVSAGNDTFSVRQHDTLTINVTDSQTTASHPLSCRWYLVQATATNPNPSQNLLDTVQNLHVPITAQIGFYNVVNQVTDKQTGVSFYKYFYLQVMASVQAGEGWLVLQDQSASSGGGDISIILSRDGSSHGAVYNNLYAGANGRKLPAGTYGMYVMNYASTLAMQKLVFAYPGGGTQVRATDYTDSSYSSAWFFDNTGGINIQNNGVVSQGQTEWLINNNQFSYLKVNATTIKTPPILFGVPVLGSWTVSPYIMQYSGLSDAYCAMYDTVHGCFFAVNTSSNNAMVPALPDLPNAHFAPYPAASAANLLPSGKGFDLNNIGKSLVYADNMQTLPYSASSALLWDCFFRSKTQDSTFVIQFPMYLAITNNISTGRYYLDPALCPGINTAAQFAVPTYLPAPGVFYYTNGNNIYTCSLSNTQGASTAAVGYGFPTGTIIKAMKIFKSEYSSPATNPKTPLPLTEGKVLVVATDETAAGNGNNVYFFNLNASGQIISPYADVYTGFDKIVDIRFKKNIGL